MGVKFSQTEQKLLCWTPYDDVFFFAVIVIAVVLVVVVVVAALFLNSSKRSPFHSTLFLFHLVYPLRSHEFPKTPKIKRNYEIK